MTIINRGNLMNQTTSVTNTDPAYSEIFELDDVVTQALCPFKFNVAGTLQLQYKPQNGDDWTDLANLTATATADVADRSVIHSPQLKHRWKWTPGSQPWTGWIDLESKKSAR